MQCFVVDVPTNELAPEVGDDAFESPLYRLPQFVARQRLHPSHLPLLRFPEDAVPTDGDSVGLAPREHGIGPGIVRLTGPSLVCIPLCFVLEDGVVEVGLEELLESFVAQD